MDILAQTEKYYEGMKDARRIFYLTGCYVSKNITQQEHHELNVLIATDDANMYLFELLTDAGCVDGFLFGLSRGRVKDNPFEKIRRRGFFSFFKKIFK
jgi:hypothetical protein